MWKDFYLVFFFCCQEITLLTGLEAEGIGCIIYFSSTIKSHVTHRIAVPPTHHLREHTVKFQTNDV